MNSTLETAFRASIEHPEAFKISFNEHWAELGYSAKQSAVRVLKEYFTEAEDYCLQLPTSKRSFGTGNLEHEYMLTGDTFKQLCLIANTAKGHETRLYYIRVEKEYRKILAARMFAAPDPRLAQLPDLYQQLGDLSQTIAEQKQQIAKLQLDRDNLRSISSGSYAELPDGKTMVYTLAQVRSILGYHSIEYTDKVIRESLLEGRDFVETKLGDMLLTQAALEELAIVARSAKGCNTKYLPEIMAFDRGRLFREGSGKTNTRYGQAR